MISKIKKPISILLSLLMVLSVFVVVPVTASAAATYTKDSAGIDDGITLVNPGDTIYTSDTSGSLLFYSDITCDYSNDGTNLGVIPCGNLWSDVDSFSINDNYMYICSSYGEPSTFIPDDGKVLKVSYRSDIDLWIIAAVDPSAIPQTPVFYTKDSEDIADGIILDSATDMICTVNTSKILVFDCDVQCDYNNEGTSVFDIRKGDTWYDTSSFLINDNNDFLFINSGTSSKLTSSSGTPFKVSYDSSENKWHIIDGSEPVPLPDDLFVKVTSEDQVTEDNIGACTFSDAKEWVYDHWDEITNGVDDGYIDFDFVYVDSIDARYTKTFGFYLNDISTKEMFKSNCNSSYVTAIDSIKESYSSDILYLCKVRDPEPATYTITDESVNGTVTASVNGTNVTEAEENADVTLTVAPAEGYQFVSISAGDVSLTTVTEGSQYSFTMPNKPVTVTAVFEEIPAAENAFVKVTSELEDWSGEYLVVYEADNAPDKVFNSAANLSSGANTLQAEFGVSDGNIDYDDTTAAAAVTIAKIGDTGYYSIKTASGKYIGRFNDTNGIDESESALDNTIAWDNDSVKITSAGGAIMRYNKSASQFRYYKTATYTNQQPIQLYKLTAAEPAPETFKAYAKKLTGETYTIENLTGETTVAQLKEIIADQIDIPATAQRLIFAGKQLEDAKTLAEYNIGNESTIHLIIRGYTVTWLNYDNSELGTTTVQYGATPSYDGEAPTKPEDANNTYTFAAWDDGTTTYLIGVDDLPPVTGDVTYTAVFTADPKATEAPTEAPDTYIVAGNDTTIFGTSWNGNDPNNTMTFSNDVWSKEYTVDGAKKEVQLKAVKNGSQWIGDETGNNVTFNLSGAGTFTVYCDGSKTWVEGDIVTYDDGLTVESVTAVGNGTPDGDNWLNNIEWDPAASANHMTILSAGLYEIEYTLGDYDTSDPEFKFAINDAWTHNFGLADGGKIENGVETDAIYNGPQNIKITGLPSGTTIKLYLDLTEFNYETKTGAKMTITWTVPATEPPTEASYTVTWMNGDEVLETDENVAEGATPSYDGETPTKDGVTFAGWTDSHGVFYAKDATLPEVTADETYTAVFELTIGSVDEWNSFAASVKGGNTYSGIIVRMTADVGPVTTMVDGTFSGTFDGDGHTLTVNISGGSTSAATFADVKDATIQNLRLEGTVTSSGIHTAALVKSVSDTGSTCTIKNVDIYADVNCSQGYIGGFIGHAGTANTVNIENSIFAGSINKTGSTQGFIGAFIGWSQKLTATINNCAFTGSYNNINSFNNIGFSYNAPTKVTVSDFYSNASEVFVANVNHGTRLYVPSSSYPTTVALVKNNDGETFYSAFSDALAAWTDGSTLALLADVTCDSMISVPANTSKILDLNGKTLTTVANNTVYGTLTIQSTVSGGNIIHSNKSQVISVQEGATLNINSGTIHGYNADRAVIGGGEGGTYNLNGGKIVTSASNAFSIGGGSTLNLNGGEIECTSDSTSMGTASAVWAHGDSTINWNGTAITTNTGDGIRMKSAGNGTVNVTGGSFTATSSSLPEEGGYAVYVNSNMSSLNLKGNPSFSGRGIYLTNDKVINITDELSNTNPISVTMQTPGVFTSGLAENGDATNFANGNGTGYALTLNASGEAQIVSTYTITWNNWDDTELEKDTGVAEGANPEYNGATPQKPDDATNYYTFSGWTPEVTAVTGDETYTATFTESEKPEVIKDCNNKYGNFRLYSNVPIVQFSNSDALLTGAIIPITYGDNNSMIPLVDAKGYSYKLYDQTGTEIPFEITSSESEPGSGYGFSDDVTVYTNVIEFARPADCNALYIVATEPAPITYTVTWMNGDDILETDTDLEPGALPSYDGETPTKDEDDDFTYEFIGWTCGPNFYTPDELPIVDGDTTYVATFESTPKHETGYYVVGTMTEWKIDDNYLLTKNTEAEGDEYVLSGVALTSNDAIKVVKYEPGNWTWYPDGMDNNYEITADGTYDIYFRPNYDGGDDWFEGCIYVVVPPHVHDFIYCDYGDTIEAICTASGCDLTDDNEVTLTIVAPTLTIVGQTGDGISEYATLTGLEAFNELTGLNIAETDIKYYAVETVEIDGNTYKRQGDELDGAPTDAGEYIAGLTLSDVKISETATRDVTARTWYTITEPAPTYTVTWMNGDDILETDTDLEPGALPSYDGETPTKDEDDDYTYAFAGWTDGENTYAADAELPAVTGDVTYTAVFDGTAKHEAGYYVVGTMTEWKIDDNYLLTKNTEAEGDEFVLNGVALTSNDAIKVVKYEPGNWTWYPDGMDNNYEITADGTYDIFFRPNYDGDEEWYENCIKAVNVTEYTVTWKNDDGSVIDTTTVVYGDTPTHADATKAPDKYYTYTFAGWTPEITAVTGDAEYTAQFTPVAKTFMVFVKRPTGSTINVYDLTGETTVAQLKAIIAEKENIPVTEQKLIFAGTQLEDEKTLAEYNIEKESTLHLVLNTYTVTWMVGEEIVETDENVDYGTTPVYDGAEPEKAEDDDYTYAFAGWTDGENTYAADAELPAVTGDVTYTAVFDGTAKHEAGYYVVGTMTEWKIEDDYLLTANTAAEGDEYMLNGVALTSNDAIKVVKYEPGNWTWYPDSMDNNYEITADGTYDIFFRPNYDGGEVWYENCIKAVNVTEYTITWKNDDDTVIDTTTVVYGDTPTHADATKDADAQYTYNFTGWTPEVVAATADAEYTATFDSVVNEYTITWKNDDGTVIDTTTVAYGDTPTHADATKESTDQFIYTFTGWTPEIVAVTGDAEYTATFDVEERILLGDADGDGEVAILDATKIQRALASSTRTVNNPAAADVDGDGEMTILDATWIQRYLASMTVKYPINEYVDKA